MRTSEHSTRTWKRLFAAMGALLGLALAPAAAQAQPCGDLEDVADDLVEYYYEWLGEFFPLDEKTCDSIATTFFKACNSAVKDGVKCIDRQIGSLVKASKPACKAEFENPSDCNEFYKEAGEQETIDIETEAEFAYDDCFDLANDLFDDCFFGF